MTRDDIWRMAQEAGFQDSDWNLFKTEPYLERFAELHKQQLIRDGWRKCAEGQHTTQFCALLEEAVRAEREACAKLCDVRVGIWIIPAGPKECADAIRARGNQ